MYYYIITVAPNFGKQQSISKVVIKSEEEPIILYIKNMEVFKWVTRLRS